MIRTVAKEKEINYLKEKLIEKQHKELKKMVEAVEKRIFYCKKIFVLRYMQERKLNEISSSHGLLIPIYHGLRGRNVQL